MKTEINYSQCILSDKKSIFSFSLNKKENYLKEIKVTLSNEVTIDLEKQRQILLIDILSKTGILNRLNNEIYNLNLKLFRIRNSIISLKQIRKDYEKRHKNIDNFLPIISRFNNNNTISAIMPVVKVTAERCAVSTCINYDRCGSRSSVTIELFKNQSESFESHLWREAITESESHSHESACFTITLVNQTILKNDYCENINCIFLMLNQSTQIKDYQRSIMASTFFTTVNYRHHYDIVFSTLTSQTFFNDLILLFPIKRRYLLSFTASIDRKSLSSIDKFIVDYLVNVSVEIQKDTGDDTVYIDVNCTPSSSFTIDRHNWNPCQGKTSRINRLNKSKFCLILSNMNINVLTSEIEQLRLIECLSAASIPVILGDLLLPFAEIIEWNKIVLRFPKQRISEVINIIENIPDSECFQLKLNGRNVLETYLISPKLQINALTVLLTKRLGLQLHKSKSFSTILYYKSLSMMYYNYSLPNFQIEIDPFLGPSEIPVTNSNSYYNNFIQYPISHGGNGMNLKSRSRIYPSTPWDSQLSTDVSLRGHLARGYLAINHTMNEAGTEFMHSLGGNFIYEQFTIIILSYKRHSTLLKSLELLNDLPYLHSIIVIWNDPIPPSYDMKWPKLHVDIKVVKTSSNSLNNRFLPYDIIRTDAILSFDDDMQLRHDEIVFAFRVWRENRDRIVGFIARYHSEYPGPPKVRYSRNQWWIYNSNYTCEYSMILTGGAFFHRFYLYAFSNDMNPKILQIINKYNNCEDIAMNFLVSHITRKPPIKVTVRWTLSCINCDSQFNSDDALHNRPDHYKIRSNCINEFATVYGYNPLLYSQYRADSVLFKTRLPVDKQKCFRYI